MTLQQNRHFHAGNDATIKTYGLMLLPTNPDMCWGSGEEVEHMLTFTSALCKAVTGFSVVTMIITIAGQIGATWRTSLDVVNACDQMPKEFLYR